MRLVRGFRSTGNRWALLLAAIVLLVLLFVSGPSYRAPRSLIAAWDLGHVAAFTLWSYLLVLWTPLDRAAPARQWGAVLAFCLVAGAATEGLQFLAGGDASTGDLLRDMAGGVIAGAWLSPSSKALPERLRAAARTFAAVVLLVACLPLASALGDEAIARIQFPVLSDFETPFEQSRWDGNARLSMDRSVARHGNASLRVDMDTSEYSGAFLVYFPRNWKGFRWLKVEVFNPSPGELELVCRIHDQAHERGDQSYEDRYNKRFRLGSGWSEIRVDLGEVAAAPAGRTMDLGAMRAVGFFAVRLPAPRTVFLDYVRLE